MSRVNGRGIGELCSKSPPGAVDSRSGVSIGMPVVEPSSSRICKSSEDRVNMMVVDQYSKPVNDLECVEADRRFKIFSDKGRV